MSDLALEWIDRRHVVCRLAPDADVPAWVAAAQGFTSVTRTPDELSIVCAESDVPPGAAIDREDGWIGFRVAAGISCFAISTFDTDYILVREADRDAAIEALGAVADVTRLR